METKPSIKPKFITGTNEPVTKKHILRNLHSIMSFKYIVFLQMRPSNDFHGSQDIHPLFLLFVTLKLIKS